jgi:tetratricopeptide (TPR) repeat protein
VSSPRRRGRTALICLLLALLVAGIYLQTARFGFVFDDAAYVAGNRQVNGGLTGEGVRSAFAGVSLGFWHPLTLLSHMLDVSLFGLHPGGHHLVAALLHAANTILCFLVLRAFTGAAWPAALAAALFAAHPLRAESVAYISERKDVLSVLFWFLTMAAWMRFLRRATVGRYLAAVGVFALGLMAKPMLVTLPFALLLLDYWPLGRLSGPGRTPARRLVLEKLPLFLLAVAASALAYVAEHRYGALSPVEPFPLAVRLQNAVYSYGCYLGKTLWPAGLAAFYPHPGRAVPVGALAAAAATLAALSAVALATLRRLPFVAVGWFWFLGTLVPVIGLVQIGDMGMADRFTYLPSVGLAVIAAWWSRAWAAGSPRRRSLVRIAAACAVAALALLAHRQAGLWRDGVTLFRHTVAVTGVNSLARYNLGVALAQAGRFAEAEREFRRTLEDDPGHLPAYDDLAAIAGQDGRPAEALEILAAGLARAPRSPKLHYRMGVILHGLGRRDEAASHLEEALRLRPGLADAHNDLGIIRAEQGRFAEAEGHFRALLELDPSSEVARENLRHLAAVRRLPPGR